MESTQQPGTSADMDPQHVSDNNEAAQSTSHLKSAKGRMRAYRMRIKEDRDKYNRLKEKDAARKRRSRATENLSAVALKNKRKKNLECVHRYREKKRELKRARTEESTSFYTVTPQSLGRALRRAKTNLPKSPRKRKAVLSKLVISETLWKKHKQQHDPMRKTLYDKVVSFYARDDISWQAPGKKDFVIIRSQGDKVKLQKRYLTMTVYEAYHCFKQEHPDEDIGKSKFAELRPQHVLRRSETPRNVCLCRYHENINLQLQALQKSDYAFPRSIPELLETCVCDVKKYECMSGKCDNCGDMHKIQNQFTDDLLNEHAADQMTWYRWETQGGRMVKCEHKGTLEELIEILLDDLPKFLLHAFMTQEQSKAFYSLRENLANDETSALVQVDFSENYTSEYQDEVQSAHWHQTQITVFTVCVWTKDNCDSKVIVSDSLEHDKNATCAFMSKIIDDITAKYPTVSNIHIFSDGAASQFKNRFVFRYLCQLHESRNIHLQWHFFATSHGKGAVDGIGGSIKRVVTSAVMSRSEIVKDAVSFTKAAHNNAKKIDVHLYTKEEIAAFFTKHGLDELWKDVRPLKGTQRLHWLQPRRKKGMVYKCFSQADENMKQVHHFDNDQPHEVHEIN